MELGAKAVEVPAGDLHDFTLSHLVRWRRVRGRRGETRGIEADDDGTERRGVGRRRCPLRAIGRQGRGERVKRCRVGKLELLVGWCLLPSGLVGLVVGAVTVPII